MKPDEPATRGETFVQSNVMPLLRHYFGADQELCDGLRNNSRTALMQAYRDENSLSSLFILVGLIMIFDYLYVLSPQSYGLLIALYGSLLLAVDKIDSPSSLAERVYLDLNPEDRIMRRARESAVNAEGTIYLAFGFLLQLISVHWSANEFLANNILQGEFSGPLVALILLGFGGVIRSILRALWPFKSV